MQHYHHAVILFIHIFPNLSLRIEPNQNNKQEEKEEDQKQDGYDNCHGADDDSPDLCFDMAVLDLLRDVVAVVVGDLRCHVQDDVKGPILFLFDRGINVFS